MFWVYVIKSSKDNNLYVGLSADPEERLDEHNSGYVKSTKGRVPFKLVYKEQFNTRNEARNREKYLKSGIGREYIKEILANK